VTLTPYAQGRDWTLYHGDCLEVLPTLDAGSIDAVVTDPPYGIGYEASRYRNASFCGVIHGDTTEFNPSPVLALNLPCVLWGGNNYAHRLPPGGWLCWDKRTNEDADRILGSPFELAWCSNRTRYKMLRCLHGGAVNADGSEARVHPTQKPVRVMAWSLEQVFGETILDPFTGSGTTGVACLKTGRRFIGIEIDEQYCEVAARRLRHAEEDTALFAEHVNGGEPEPALFAENGETL
jgi:site-specific DNA-methyltransferase (adenine-specific)